MRAYSWFLTHFLLAGGLLPGLASTASAQQPQLRATLATSPGPDSLLRLGSPLTLEVAGLPPGLATHRLTLYLNGVPLRGLAPLAAYSVAPAGVEAGATSSAPGGETDSSAQMAFAALPQPNSAAPALTKVVFVLRRTAAPAAWALADGPPWQAAHPVRLGLGTSHQLLAELPSRPPVRLAPAFGWQAGLGVAALASLLLLLGAARSWLLRTPLAVPLAADGQPLAVVEAAPPYSLARVQLAWWSWLVLGGGLVSASVTGALPMLPAAVLALLGVSVGTAVLAALAHPPVAEDEPPRYSRGWLADLLCDERGLAIHRLQFVLTSLAVGSSFIYTLYATGVLPAWLPGPALLLAFSSLAYVGPKWRRARPQPAAPAPVAAPAYLAWPGGLPAWPPAPLPQAAPAPDYAAATHPDALPRPVLPTPAPLTPRPAPSQPTSLAPEPTPAEAQPLAAATLPADVVMTTLSRADPATGEVLYHEEDDMGPLEEEDYPSWPTGS